MLNINELPRIPSEAVKFAVSHALSIVGAGNTPLIKLKQANHPIYKNLFLTLTIARNSAARLQDEDIKELLIQNLVLNDAMELNSLRNNLEFALNVIVSIELDDHFLDADAVNMYDRAELDEADKKQIRKLMADARGLVDTSSALFEQQKKNVLFHISKIENELHKTKSSFQTFLAAAYDMSGLLKQVGKDAEPIAEAIEKARTITEKRVSGYNQLTEEEKPKQLPKPETAD